MSEREPSTPPVIPGFNYQRFLTFGGFADVFIYTQDLGRNQGPGREVAVKVLLKDVQASARANLEAEAAVMARLSSHPHIVSMFQAGVSRDGRPFLVMEYCPPPDLAKQVRGRQMSVADALTTIIQIAGAVETAHQAGIIHRDIKPSNILRTDYKRPVLTDFGISLSAAGAVGGGVSVGWAPPEQILGQATTTSADVYALAATLHTCLTGRAPFEVPGGVNDWPTMAARAQSMPVPGTGRADVPDSLQRIIATAMAKDPARRYASARSFALALQQVQSELGMGQTLLDVLDGSLPDDELDVEDDGRTRVGGVLAIDPDRPAGVTLPGGAAGSPVRFGGASDGAGAGAGVRDFTAGVADTELRPPPGPSGAGTTIDRNESGTGAERDGGRGPRRGVLIGAAVVVLALIGGGVVLSQQGRGAAVDETAPTTAAAQPVDALGAAESVPAPAGLTGQVQGTQAVFTWTVPEPEAGDHFFYNEVDPLVPEPDVQETQQPTASLTWTPPRTCIEVSLVRADGRSSDQPARACVSG